MIKQIYRVSENFISLKGKFPKKLRDLCNCLDFKVSNNVYAINFEPILFLKNDCSKARQNKYTGCLRTQYHEASLIKFWTCFISEEQLPLSKTKQINSIPELNVNQRVSTKVGAFNQDYKMVILDHFIIEKFWMKNDVCYTRKRSLTCDINLILYCLVSSMPRLGSNAGLVCGNSQNNINRQLKVVYPLHGSKAINKLFYNQ